MTPAFKEQAKVARAVAIVLIDVLGDELDGIKSMVRHPDDGEVVIEMMSGARFRVAVRPSE